MKDIYLHFYVEQEEKINFLKSKGLTDVGIDFLIKEGKLDKSYNKIKELENENENISNG